MRSQTYLRQPTYLSHTDASLTSDVDPIKVAMAILLPPVAVYSEVSLGVHFWLNAALTLCGYLPGIVHALYIIMRPGPVCSCEPRRC